MEDAVLSSSFAIKANTAMSQNTAEEFFNISEEEALNQLLENNNFDAFWDLLGENLSDMPSLWEYGYLERLKKKKQAKNKKHCYPPRFFHCFKTRQDGKIPHISQCFF